MILAFGLMFAATIARVQFLVAVATKTVWGDVLGRFRKDHPELVRGWFGELQLVALSGGVLTIEAGSPPEKEYLEQECGRAFAGVAQVVLGRFITISVTLRGERVTVREALPIDAAQHAAPKEFTFDTFVKAPCNDLAYAAAEAVVDGPGEHYNPLFLFGGAGTGKTHLLLAICADLRKSQPESQVVYVRCRTFMDEYVDAFDHDELPRFRSHYREADLLAIDDIQALAGNERSQEEFFHTFETAYKAGRQVVLSANASPTELGDMPERITTRLGLGLVASLEPPSRETRLAILASRARARCLELGEGVPEFLADRYSASTPDLVAGFDKIDELARAQGARIDLSLARRALEDGCDGVVPVAAVIDAVCRRMEVDRADLLSRKRARRTAFAREVALFLSRRVTRLSLEEVGEIFGGRGHVEVLEAAQAMRDRLSDDAELSTMLDEIAADAKNAAC